VAVPTSESEDLVLVDVAKLQALIEAAPGLDPSRKDYLRKRWLHQIRWWDKRAWEARKRYFGLRVAIVVGGVLLPFLTTASFGNKSLDSHGDDMLKKCLIYGLQSPKLCLPSSRDGWGSM